EPYRSPLALARGQVWCGRRPACGYTGAMQVEVHLHAELVRLAPDHRGVLTLDLPDGAHVADLLEHLSLGADTQRRVIVGLNGEAAGLDHELVDGARIDVLTAMVGGAARVRPS